jgi:hydroxymethylglutaryl-CoA lyase
MSLAAGGMYVAALCRKLHPTSMEPMQLQIVECPRDAMQGWKHPIPTVRKVEYLNLLLGVGFHTLDFGSFVSPRAVPQMADTRDVLAGLQWRESDTRLLAIVLNERGAEEALALEGVSCLGFPLSVSETFQRRNANCGVQEGFERFRRISELCGASGREAVAYLSMAFGNPYGDAYGEDAVLSWAEQCLSAGASVISLADTVGLASPSEVGALVEAVNRRFPDSTIGVHLHAGPGDRHGKLSAAYQAGCRRFDAAIGGIGGCPMAGDDLVGNIDTSDLVRFLGGLGCDTGLDQEAFRRAKAMADTLFQTNENAD